MIRDPERLPQTNVPKEDHPKPVPEPMVVGQSHSELLEPVGLGQMGNRMSADQARKGQKQAAAEIANKVLENGLVTGQKASALSDDVVRGNDRKLEREPDAVFVTLRSIKKAREGPVTSSPLVPNERERDYATYGEYVRAEVRNLLNARNSYNSPAGILGERDSPDGLNVEYEKLGKDVMEERLESKKEGQRRRKKDP